MLSKNEIAQQVEELTGIKPNLTKSVMDAMAEIGTNEVASGKDFSVPGICRISWRYRKPQAKGARWKKGDTVTGFGDVESVKDADSPEVKGQVTLKAEPMPAFKRVAPKKSDRKAQANFLSRAVGKRIALRKG